MKNKHIPVLLKECIEQLQIFPNGIYLDCTYGKGGHSKEILNKLGSTGKLIAIDQDYSIVQETKEALDNIGNFEIFHTNFKHLEKVLGDNYLGKIDGILADIGVSSIQLDSPSRGFSFNKEGPLDMRMDQSLETTAEKIINLYSLEKLVEIFRTYGEERFAKPIARNIIRQRDNASISSTLQLAEICKQSIPRKLWKEKHPATRVFQAIRIEVNSELDSLKGLLNNGIQYLKPGGRLLIITFHSLEDRIVKNFFKQKVIKCTCPKSIPICTCDTKPSGKIITPRPITPSEKEIKINPRSRSAKLRVLEKL